MDLALLASTLPTRWLGKKIYHQDSIDSTNAWAKREIASGAPRGSLFLAEHQTSGRGRLKRAWEAPTGKNILVSFLDAPAKNPVLTYQLALLTGVAFLEGIASQVPTLPFQLKWPNDLLVGGKKMGGILCENPGRQTIIGVGLNINATLTDFSPEVAPLATSVFIETQAVFSREAILAACLTRYEEWRGRYDQDGLSPVIATWNQKSALAGKAVEIVEGSSIYQGEVEGLDENGFLTLRTEDGAFKTVTAGDVTLCS